ncbi:D-alanine--D-alanine ligase family protein [Exilibacterium tricleocarpae]|nr:D-alanine--D-alanine ligase family protein [Exilibacterium tricleocarpae]
MNDKINVAIVFGGQSAEHKVSLQSAFNLIEVIDRSKYHPFLLGIDRAGVWFLYPDFYAVANRRQPVPRATKNGVREVALVRKNGCVQVLDLDTFDGLGQVDVIMPVLHGPSGEDGCLQGLAQMLGVPCVGSGVLSSAVCMDKDICKRLLQHGGIEVADYLVLDRDHNVGFDKLVRKLGSPLYVKPANMGSSIGVSKVASPEALAAALAMAFRYDSKVLVERAVQGREIECAVIGNDYPRVSKPGEVVVKYDYYSYTAKYLDSQGAELKVPADLDDLTTKMIQELAADVYTLLGCQGMARIDMFLTEADEVIVNEVNTVPGFTHISMFPKLWQAGGMNGRELLDHLILSAVDNYCSREAMTVRLAGCQ